MRCHIAEKSNRRTADNQGCKFSDFVREFFTRTLLVIIIKMLKNNFPSILQFWTIPDICYATPDSLSNFE